MPQRPPRQRLSSNAIVVIKGANCRIVGNTEIIQKRASMKLAGLVPMSQLVGRDPVIEVAVAGLLPALLRVALHRYRDPATRAQALSPSQARVRIPSRVHKKQLTKRGQCRPSGACC